MTSVSLQPVPTLVFLHSSETRQLKIIYNNNIILQLRNIAH
jgi:hypothetical protein